MEVDVDKDIRAVSKGPHGQLRYCWCKRSSQFKYCWYTRSSHGTDFDIYEIARPVGVDSLQ